MPERFPISPEVLQDICRRWQITEFALFGSILRPDFRPDSDVDVLVSFAADARWSLFDIVRLQDELAALLGRPVSIVEERALRNPFRRAEILRTRKTVYAA